MTPIESINLAVAEVLDLTRQVREFSEKFAVLDGLVTALMDEQDVLILSLQQKTSALEQARLTIAELQAIVKRGGRIAPVMRLQ